MKHFRARRLQMSEHLATGIAITLAAGGLLLYRLYALAPGLAASETALPTVHSSLRALWNTPLEAPLLMSRLLVAAISPSTGIALSRLPNVLLGLLVVALSYWLIKKWYGLRLALFGTLLLITGPSFLHYSRLATSDVVYPLAMISVMCLAALWHQRTLAFKLKLLSAVAIAGLLYVPGGLWLLIVVAAFERKNLAAHLKANTKQSLSAAALSVLLLVPLLHMFITNWHSYHKWLGLPSQWPAPLTYVKHFAHSWQYIFVNGLNDPVHNLGRLPLVNSFIVLSFLVGVYLYSMHLQAVRTKQLLALWLIGTALIAFNGPVKLSLLLPIVFVLAGGGIGYLLHLWLKTFPRNPYARSFGIGLVALVTLFAIAYNLRSYYIAWPHTPAVKAAFTRQLEHH